MNRIRLSLADSLTVARRWAKEHFRATRAGAWLVAALIAFAIAADLTRRIAYAAEVLRPYPAATRGTVWTQPESWYQFAVWARPGAAAAHLQLTYLLTETQLRFQLPAEASELWVWNSEQCDYTSQRLTKESRPPQTLTPLPNSIPEKWTFIDLTGLTLGSDHAVTCFIRPGLLRETFSSSVSLLYNRVDPGDTARDRGLVPIGTEIRINAPEGPSEIVSWSDPLGEPHVLNPGHHLVVRQRSIRDEQRRDWYLVVIGIFISLGSAMCIEAVRPFLE